MMNSGSLKSSVNRTLGSLGKALLVPIIIAVIMISLEVWDIMLSLAVEGRPGGWLDRFAIRPRQLSGLVGIIYAPFLHQGLFHLIGNLIPFLGLSYVVMLSGLKRYLTVTFAIIFLTGSAVWLLARSNPHLGASGLVFGYIGYLLVKGVVEKSVLWIAISLVILVTFIGYAQGLLPGQKGVSWESHLFGFLSGIAVASFLGKQKLSLEAKKPLPWESNQF